MSRFMACTLNLLQKFLTKAPHNLNKAQILTLFLCLVLLSHIELSYANACSDVFNDSKKPNPKNTIESTETESTTSVVPIDEKGLSKSQYCRGKRCQKSLWLYRNRKELADKPTPFMQNILDQGTAVGKLATQLFKDGILVSEGHKQAEAALKKTDILIRQKKLPAIFEGAFIFKDVLVRVDVLKNNFDGTWDLIEVKSTTKVEPKSHLDDAAIQKWVLDNNGIKIRKTILMHLNSNYIRKGKLNLKELFVLEDISEAIKPHYEVIDKELDKIKAAIALSIEPKELIGTKCNNPYVCSFKSYCWTHAQPGTIHTLSRLHDRKRHELMNMDIEMISQIPITYKLSANQKTEYLSHVHGKPQIDIQNIAHHLNELKYPLYFLDYESASYAVPKFDGSWPYKHLTTQYSLHIQKFPGAEIIHKIYLHNENSNPSKVIARKLLEDIADDGGSIIVYHKPYEKMRTKELANELPEYQDQLNSLIDRMWDLATPFAKRWYWDKEFNGSYSIKSVLPVLNPKFSYSDLEIQAGNVAQLQYDIMVSLPKNSPQRKHLADALLKYSERDTLAMVVILEQLQKILQNPPPK